MYSVKVTWDDGEVSILKNLTFEKAQQWAAYYNEKAKDPRVQWIVGVSIVSD